MTKHMTNKELAGYIAGSMSDRSRGLAAGHLARCDRCRARHEKMLAAISPRYPSLQASPAARTRIMRSREKLAGGETASAPKGIRSLLALHPRAILAASLTLIVAAVAVAALLIRMPAERERLHLAVIRADAGVTINDRPAREHARVHERSSIRLPDKTMLRLEHGRGFSITLTGPGIFSIDRFASRGQGEHLKMECTLARGILISASDSTASMTCAYNTPGARVEPIGTEFLLQSAGGKTLVVMKAGSVRVRPVQSAESVTVSGGSRCMIDKKAEITPAAPEDMTMFGSMEKLRAGAFSRRLLKPEPVGKDATSKSEIDNGRPVEHGVPRNGIRHKSMPGIQDDRDNKREKADRREKIQGPVKPGIREQERINKNKKIIRETQKVIRQKRRATR